MEAYFIISVIIFGICFFNLLPKRGFANAIVASVLTALFYPVVIVIVILISIYNGIRNR